MTMTKVLIVQALVQEYLIILFVNAISESTTIQMQINVSLVFWSTQTALNVFTTQWQRWVIASPAE